MTLFKQYFFILAILLFAVLIRIPALPQPLGPDQGIMSAIGQGLLRGEIPYRDNWEMASPAIFFTYALFYKVFGPDMMAVPIADMVVALTGTFLVFILGKKLFGKSAGLLSAFLYTFFANGVSIGMNSPGDLTAGTYWYIAQRESFVSPLIVLGMIFVVKGMEERRSIWFAFIGLLGGILFLFKFPFLLIFISQLVFLNDTKDVRSWVKRKEFYKKNGLAVLGFIAILIPVLWFFWEKGAFAEMIDATIVYVYSIYGELQTSYIGVLKSGLIKSLTIARESFLLWACAIASCSYIIANEKRKTNLLVVTWLAVSFLVIVLHKEFFGYHYLPIFPPLSLLTAYFIKKVFENLSKARLAILKDAKVMILIFAMLANITIYLSLNYKHYTRFIRYSTGQKSAEWYYAHFTAYPNHEYSFPGDYCVSNFIRQNANPSDTIFVLGGIESVIHVLTGLRSPSRFVYSWFLFSTERSHTEIAERYRKELLHELQNKAPRYIVTIGPLDNYRRSSSIHELVQTKYKLIRTFVDERYLFELTA